LYTYTNELVQRRVLGRCFVCAIDYLFEGLIRVHVLARSNNHQRDWFGI
jgi:hypothetical protein